MRIEDLKFTKPGPAIKAVDIAAFEATISATLPDDYRRFLLAFNGGQSKLCVCEEPFFRMRLWFSLTDDETPPLAPLTKVRERLRPELGDEFLPIGEDVLEKTVVMKVLGTDQYRIGVWHWDRETREEIQLPLASFTDLAGHFVQTDEFM